MPEVERTMGLSFGADLRERRLAASLSLHGLSQRVHYSRSHLSKVENGVKPPSPELAQQCDKALDAGGALAAQVKRPVRSRRIPDSSPAADDDVLMIGPDMVRLVPRGAADGGTSIVASTRPGWTDDSVLTRYRNIFDHFRSLGQSVRPVDVIPGLVANAYTISGIARDAGAALRDDLFRLAARYAEHAGWMAQELGDGNLAIRWTDWATHLAALGGEDLTAFRLVRFGDLSMYDGDAALTIEHATSALHRTQNLRVRGLAAQRLAHGHALAGDGDACFRALDLSAELLAQASTSGDEPVMGSSTVADHRAMASGWCLYDLRQPDKAADILATEINRLPQHAHRARARYGTRLARCYADMDELDQACATAEPVLRMLPSLDSATIRTDMSGLEASLRRRLRHPAVKHILPLVAEARPWVRRARGSV